MKKLLPSLMLCVLCANAEIPKNGNQGPKEGLTLAEQLHAMSRYKTNLNQIFIIMQAYLNLSDQDKNEEIKAAEKAAKNHQISPHSYQCTYDEETKKQICRYDEKDFAATTKKLTALEKESYERLGDCIKKFGQHADCYAKNLYFEKQLKKMVGIYQNTSQPA